MKIFTIISVLFGGFCLFWLWLHWGRRGAYVAMFASYYTAKRALKRNNPSATEKEINYLIGKAAAKGLTILPIRVYTKGSVIKLEIAVARRLKQRDQRAKIMEREGKRKIERTLKEI